MMSDIRPVHVSEAAWRRTEARGATYVRILYPSFIDLPEHTAFLTGVGGIPVYIHFVRSARGLSLIDYGIELHARVDGDARIPTLSGEIKGIDPDNLSIDLSDSAGSAGIGLVIEKQRDRFWRNVPFSELVIGWEWESIDKHADLTPSTVALRTLVQACRFRRHDLRVRLAPSVTGEIPAIRSRAVPYDRAATGNAYDRLSDFEPKDFHHSIVSFADAVPGVAASALNQAEADELANHVTAHLHHSIQMPEMFVELEILAERAQMQLGRRPAFAEAMTLAELTIGAAARRLLTVPQVRASYREGHECTWKHMSEKLLPAVLLCYDGEKTSLLRRLKLLVNIRHRVIHHGYTPTPHELSEVLSVVHTLIMILLFPSFMRANFKLRAGLREPEMGPSELE